MTIVVFKRAGLKTSSWMRKHCPVSRKFLPLPGYSLSRFSCLQGCRGVVSEGNGCSSFPSSWIEEIQVQVLDLLDALFEATWELVDATLGIEVPWRDWNVPRQVLKVAAPSSVHNPGVYRKAGVQQIAIEGKSVQDCTEMADKAHRYARGQNTQEEAYRTRQLKDKCYTV